MPLATTDLLLFVTAALALNLTPGNDMMFVLGQSVRSGTAAGIAAGLGIATGSLVHLLLVALGLAVVLARHPLLFDAIRYLGAAYLLWLAWRAWTTATATSMARAAPRSAWRAWRDGTIVNLLNPKVIVFMFAFLPPFIRPENGAPLLQLLILGLIFNAGGTLVNIAVAVFAGRAATVLTANARAAMLFGRLTASLFVLLAARLAFERR
jgi:threonine/homoserine/homoserine lactone efflux protein